MKASLIPTGGVGTTLVSLLPGPVHTGRRYTIIERVPRSRLTGSIVTKIAVALALAAGITAIVAPTAFADRGHDRRHEHRRYTVYAPPTVYYPQVASPGISLVFPIQIR
jgi:hypothetical protein